MRGIFLSAGVPVPGRGIFHETADPFLIQTAVREFVMVTLGRRLIVWGGQPAITPMIWAACEDLGVNYAEAVVLYQSRFFQDDFPQENANFGNVVYVDAVAGDQTSSLLSMRQSMLSRSDLDAAVFIGGMEGILDEFELFGQFHPNASILLVPSPGGAALQLATTQGAADADLQNVDFVRLFYDGLGISPDEQRA